MNGRIPFIFQLQKTACLNLKKGKKGEADDF